MENKLNYKQTLRFLPFVAIPLQAEATEAGPGAFFNEMFSGANAEQQILLLTAIGLVLLLIVLAFVLMGEVLAVHHLLNKRLRAENATEAELAEATQPWSFWKWFWDKFNGAASVSREQDILLDHDYDGIHELDNNLPPWWKYGFYFSIVFAVVYIFRFHIAWDGDEVVSIQEYKDDVLQAEIAKTEYLATLANSIDETNVEMTEEATAIANGKQIFDQNCKVCHGGQGEGGVGPNLTDVYWLHGGDVKSIFKTIKYGVPEKGMLPWQDKLRPQEMQELSSYILTLQGTNPPNAKEPQGTEYKPEE